MILRQMDNNTKQNSNESKRQILMKNKAKKEIPLSIYQTLSSCNIQDVCRICLSTHKEMLHSVFFHDVEKYVLRDMFIELTSLQVNDEDGLPNNICNSCREDVVHCYNFKLKCLDSDYILKTVFSSTFDYTDDAPESNDLNTHCDEINTENKEVIDETDSCEKSTTLLSVKENTQKLSSCISNETSEVKINKKRIKTRNRSKLKQHKCTYCQKSFVKENSLQNHIEKLHNLEKTNVNNCSKCKYTFSCAEDLMLHQSLHNKDAWKCNRCGKEFNVRTALKRHLLRHMSTRAFSCESCGKMFVERCALLRHQSVHTGVRPPKKLACQLCDKRFLDNCRLSMHMKTHSGERESACEACGKRFASLRLLLSHQRVHSDHKPYACNYCDKRFRHESARKTHHRTHTGERPYVCSECGKKFIQQSNLNTHMRSHTGEKPYSCKTCGRDFSSCSALKSHERTHTGEKPYSCKICGKRFTRKDTKVHMRLHTGERPYKCSVCPRRFNNSSHLREHGRIHTGERPFQCALCSRKFTTKSHIVKHLHHHEKKKAQKTQKPYKISNKNHSNKYISNEYCDEEDSENSQDFSDIEETSTVGQELVPSDENYNKTDAIVHNDAKYIHEGFVRLTNDINKIVKKGKTSVASVMDRNTLKMYQYDQSLLQIHSADGQLTISKITSKMTANF